MRTGAFIQLARALEHVGRSAEAKHATAEFQKLSAKQREAEQIAQAEITPP
jgi:hypothetical protein